MVYFEEFRSRSKGKGYWVRAKEVTGWVPDFDDQSEKDSDSEDEQSKGVIKEDFGNSNVESMVPDTVLEKEDIQNVAGEGISGSNDQKSDDPFDLYPLLNKKKDNETLNSSDSLKFPPGFTPSEDIEEGSNSGPGKDAVNGEDSAYVSVGSGLNSKAKKDWVKEICVSNKVNFLTLQETKMESIDLFDVKKCWGNLAFDYVVSPAVGFLGGILCVWEKSSF
nr:RNA-directed DNA polymerase, eukaryota [Tanacetum cinerariifolium]